MKGTKRPAPHPVTPNTPNALARTPKMVPLILNENIGLGNDARELLKNRLGYFYDAIKEYGVENRDMNSLVDESLKTEDPVKSLRDKMNQFYIETSMKNIYKPEIYTKLLNEHLPNNLLDASSKQSAVPRRVSMGATDPREIIINGLKSFYRERFDTKPLPEDIDFLPTVNKYLDSAKGNYLNALKHLREDIIRKNPAFHPARVNLLLGDRILQPSRGGTRLVKIKRTRKRGLRQGAKSIRRIHLSKTSKR